MYDLHLFFTAWLWIVTLLVYSRSSINSVFHPISFYLFFHGLVFVVRPFFQYYLNLTWVYDLYGFWPSDKDKHLTLLAVNVGMLCFVSWAALIGRTQIKFWTPSHAREQNRYGGHFLVALAISMPLILASFRYALSANFGEVDLRNMVRDAETFHTIYTDTTGYVVDANVMLGSFGAIIAWAFRFRLLSLIPFLLFFCLRLSIGWSRYSFIMAGAGLALLYLFDQRRKWPSGWMLAGALGVLVLFASLSSQRDWIANWIKGVPTVERVENRDRAHFFDGLDFANLEFVEYMVYTVPELTGTYNYFANSLEVFTAPIPRMLWPEKPVGPPIRFFELNDYGFPVGNTPTLVGEGWRSLGIPGVVIWCSFAGILWGYLYRNFTNHSDGVFGLLYYVVLLPLSVQWFRDGLLLTMVKFPLFFLLPIALTQGLVWMTGAGGKASQEAGELGVTGGGQAPQRATGR